MEILQFHDVDGLEVASWSPGLDGEEIPCTQVHVILDVPEPHMKVIIRLKSARAVDELIAVLQEHRAYVFGANGSDSPS